MPLLSGETAGFESPSLRQHYQPARFCSDAPVVRHQIASCNPGRRHALVELAVMVRQKSRSRKTPLDPRGIQGNHFREH
jgi:hypothetical protein